MKTVRLSVEEKTAFQQLVGSRLPSTPRPPGMRPSGNQELVSALCPGLQSDLVKFTDTQPVEGVLLIKGIPIPEGSIGPTPTSWATCEAASASDDMLVAFGSLLGKPFAWENQQKGALVHNILPISAHALKQVGSSSAVELAWHTEDAFHPGRADYVCLLCLRNPDRIATTVANLADFDATLAKWKPLWQRRFLIWADDSYFPDYTQDLSTEAVGALSATRVNSTEPCSVLFGPPNEPYLRIDPAYMGVVQDDAEAAAALREFKAVITFRLFDVVLGPGDLLVIDNFRAVHGRRAFVATYRGTDRWLKRLNITLDTQNTAAKRLSPRAEL